MHAKMHMRFYGLMMRDLTRIVNEFAKAVRVDSGEHNFNTEKRLLVKREYVVSVKEKISHYGNQRSVPKVELSILRDC